MNGMRVKMVLSTLAIAIAGAMSALVAPAHVGEIKIAAASDLTFAFADLAARFEKETGNPVKLSFGSSGNFFSQISNGAPFDLFFSADLDYPKRLEAAGLAEPGTIYQYATGRIVLWAPAASSLDLRRGMDVLIDPAVHKIAIANPEHAPYGRAAVAALKHAGIYDRVKDKLVLGENISQAAQFVQSGNAEVGILAMSIALAPAMKDRGRFVAIAAADYPPIVQAACMLKASHQPQIARQFLQFMRAPKTVAAMERYGFKVTTEIAGQQGAAPAQN